MDVVITIAIVAVLVIGYQRLRAVLLRRAAKEHGLQVVDAPTLDQHEDWLRRARLCHPYTPRAWLFGLDGNRDGARLRAQEQQLKPDLGSNARWHTLWVWEYPGWDLPSFQLADRPPTDIDTERLRALREACPSGPLGCEGNLIAWLQPGLLKPGRLHEALNQADRIRRTLVDPGRAPLR